MFSLPAISSLHTTVHGLIDHILLRDPLFDKIPDMINYYQEADEGQYIFDDNNTVLNSMQGVSYTFSATLDEIDETFSSSTLIPFHFFNQAHDLHYSLSSIAPNVNSDSFSKYILDSGANVHLFMNSQFFNDLVEFSSSVTTASLDNPALTYAKGTAGYLKEVLFTKNLPFNLISVGKLSQEGISTVFEDSYATLLNSRKEVICYAPKKNGLYLISEDDVQFLASMNPSDSLSNIIRDNELFELHRKMGHSDMRNLKRAVQNNDIIISDPVKRRKILESELVHCPICYSAKPRRVPVNTSRAEKHEVMSKFGLDFKGYFPTSVHGGFTCAFIFVDFASHFTFVFLAKAITQAAEAIQACVTKVVSLGFAMKFLQTDDDPNFKSAQVRNCLLNLNITHHTSVPYTPWMNGRVERTIGTLFGLTRALLIDSGAPVNLWAFALTHSAFLWNCTPRSIGEHSPLTFLRKILFDATKLPYFYTKGKCMARDATISNSLSPRTINCRFLGFYNGNLDIFIVFTEEQKIMITRDARFDLRLDLLDKPIELPPNYDARINDSVSLEGHAAMVALGLKVPRSIKEALSSPEHIYWSEALSKERDNFILYKTFSHPGVIPPNASILNSLLVFTKTTDNEGRPKYKVRLVARGDQQCIADKDSLFAPTTPSEVNKMILSVAASRGMIIQIFDVTAAFLEGRNDRIEYVRIPRFFAIPFNQEDNVVKIEGNFYGCRQAPRIWADRLRNCLINIGCVASEWVPTLYFYTVGSDRVIITTHVDDGLMAATSLWILEDFKLKFSSQVKQIKYTTEFTKFLGMELFINNNSLQLSHEKYLNEHFPDIVLSKLPVLDPKILLSERSPEATSEDFLHLVGTLRFAVDRARPDLVGFTNEISTGQYSDPLGLIRKVIGFARSTSHHRLKFFKSQRKFLHCFTDASLVKTGDGKSRIGAAYFLNDVSGAFHSFSTKIPMSFSTVSVSSCESELKGLYECSARGLYFREILIEIGYLPPNSPCIVFTDNAPVISIIKKGSGHSNIRLLTNRIISIQEYIARGHLSIVHIDSELNVADVLTKGTLTQKRFKTLSSVLLEGYHSYPDLANKINTFETESVDVSTDLPEQ